MSSIGLNNSNLNMDELAKTRELADEARLQGRWSEALEAYRSLPNHMDNSALLLNQAICYFGLAEYNDAENLAQKAYSLQRSLWQAQFLLAKSQRKVGNTKSWADTISRLARGHRDNPEVMMEFASALMSYFGNAVYARKIARAYFKVPHLSKRSRHIALMCSLYDRSPEYSAQLVTADIILYAREFFLISNQEREGSRSKCDQVVAKLQLQGCIPKKSKTKRIGFISGLFTASPVYFLAIDAIRKIAQTDQELVFFSRKAKHDWATEEFKSLATFWIDCSSYSAVEIEATIAASEIDELFEMAGWTDTDVLRALASKPALKQYKWVGGQGCSTGMSCFDGFLTDQRQTPPSAQQYYTEPLLSIGEHYANYTPPPYMPPGRVRSKGITLPKLLKKGIGLVGVVANPLKISTLFLKALKDEMSNWPVGLRLQFIDHRFDHPITRLRIEQALGPDLMQQVVFVTPIDHPDFLGSLNLLDLMIDTFPYSGGLTVCEARYLNIPIHLFPADRLLFCERHSISHLER